MLCVSIMFILLTPFALANANPAVPVIVESVSSKSYASRFQALGTLYANESVELTSTVTEFITAVHFKDGQRVKAGEVLMEMDVREELAQLAEEESHLKEATRQKRRLEPLVKQGAASEAAIDEQHREVETSKARIDAIKVRIDLHTIKAPFDGVLGLRRVSVGALMQPGKVVTTLDDDSVMKLDFTVPETYLSSLVPQSKVIATTEVYPGETFEAVVDTVDSRVDPVTRSVVVRALLDNDQGLFKPGMLMKVAVVAPERQALLIPEAAILPIGEQFMVYVLAKGEDSDYVEKRIVTLGERQVGYAEILSGLQEGEQVVIEGTVRIRPGQAVKVIAPLFESSTADIGKEAS